MNSFRTEVQIDKPSFSINYNNEMLFMGSCFATNMGQFFNDHCFNAMVNPFGVLYNPFSIAQSLERLLQNEPFTDDDYHFHNENWHTFYHHSSFNKIDKKKFSENINKHFELAKEHLNSTKYLFITFGTAWAYKHTELNQVVSNCHKYPPATFSRFLLTQEQIVDRYRSLIMSLHASQPKLQIIFTVSPVRHWKDGAHGNQISKATLLLAINQLQAEFEHVRYFPAYEIQLDELRDYRFYNDDMLHPSPLAVQFIREKLLDHYFHTSGHQFINQVNKFRKALDHRPFNSQSDSYIQFLKDHLRKLEQLQFQYKHVDLSILNERFKERLADI